MSDGPTENSKIYRDADSAQRGIEAIKEMFGENLSDATPLPPNEKGKVEVRYVIDRPQ